MISVVGYEGSPLPSYPIVWGSAAVHYESSDRVTNSALGGYGIPYDEWRRIARVGNGATETQVKIPVDLERDLFVVDMSLDLMDTEPYKVDAYSGILRVYPGIVGIGRGRTRGYYVFENHSKLKSWIYNMNAGKFKLVPA